MSGSEKPDKLVTMRPYLDKPRVIQYPWIDGLEPFLAVHSDWLKVPNRQINFWATYTALNQSSSDTGKQTKQFDTLDELLDWVNDHQNDVRHLMLCAKPCS